MKVRLDGLLLFCDVPRREEDLQPKELDRYSAKED